jgi:hypothetical protein
MIKPKNRLCVMGGFCTISGMEFFTKFLSENVMGIANLGDLGVNGMVYEAVRVKLARDRGQF